MNVYKIVSARTPGEGGREWKLKTFYVVAPDIHTASLMAQTEGIRRMNIENDRIAKFNADNPPRDPGDVPFGGIFGGMTQEVPLIPEYVMKSITVVDWNVAVDGL